MIPRGVCFTWQAGERSCGTQGNDGRAAFTLIELLVVVAIIGVLAAMLLPGLNKARQRALITTCAGSQRQAFLGFSLYADDYTDYPSQLTGDTKANYGNSAAPISCGTGIRFNGDDGGGSWALGLLLSGKYTTAQRTLQCSATKVGGNTWKYAHRYSVPWFDFNGPNVNGQCVGNYGHTNGMYEMGKHFGNNAWCAASFGVDYGWQNYAGVRSGKRLQPNDVAFIGCNAIMNEPATIEMYEPHLERPLTALGGNHQGSSWGSLMQYRRNYTFADGHTTFVSQSPRPAWSWTPN